MKGYVDHSEIYEKYLDTHLEHSRKWGYPTYHLSKDLVGDGTSFKQSVYSKLAYTQTLMATELAKLKDKRAEWIVWYDAHVILLNSLVPWETFLPPTTPNFNNSTKRTDLSHIHLLISRDRVGFDSGVFLIRVHRWSLKVLYTTLAFPYLQPEEYTKLGDSDQGLMGHILDLPENRQHRIYQPRGWWNPYNAFKYPSEKVRKGAIGLHFPGGNVDRKSRMGRWLRTKKREEFQVELAETGYVEEVKEYWKRVEQATQAVRRAKEAIDTLGKTKLENRNRDHGLVKVYEDLKKTVYEEADESDKLQAATSRLDEALQNEVSSNVGETVNEAEMEEENGSPWYIQQEEW